MSEISRPSCSRHAYLVLGHKSPRQINVLTRLLLTDGGQTDIYLHLDAKAAHLLDDITPRPGLSVCSHHPIVWGGFDMVRATLSLMRQAMEHGPYDRLHLLSGQCLPLRPPAAIRARFDAAPATQFMACMPFPVPGLPYQGFDRILVDYPPELRGRFRGVKARRLDDYKEAVLHDPARHRRVDHLPHLYHGSQWFSITGAFAEYILQYVDAHPDFTAYFESSLIPDEMFFQTILMASPFAAHQDSSISRYMDWTQGGPHTFRAGDLEALLTAQDMFARKFDCGLDEAIVARMASTLALRAVRPGLSVSALAEAAQVVRTLSDAGHTD